MLRLYTVYLVIRSVQSQISEPFERSINTTFLSDSSPYPFITISTSSAVTNKNLHRCYISKTTTIQSNKLVFRQRSTTCRDQYHTPSWLRPFCSSVSSVQFHPDILDADSSFHSHTRGPAERWTHTHILGRCHIDPDVMD